MKISNEVPYTKWRDYVQAHHFGTFFHLPEWKEIIEDSFGHKPVYIFALDIENNILGILPLFQIRSLLTGNRLVSLPFAFGGPIANSDEIVNHLIEEGVNQCEKLKCKYLELRTDNQNNIKLKTSDYFSNFLLLLKEPKELWKNLDPKSVRWAITKAVKEGVVTKLSSNFEDLQYFYEINQRTKKNLGVPGHPLIFFKNIFMQAGQFVKLYIAELKGKRIAGIICLSYKDTVYYAYAASEEKYLKYHPNNLLVWRAIEDSYNAGYHYFDFGKTSPDNKGLVSFKKHWGTIEKKLYYYYYPNVPKLLSSNRQGIRYKIVTGLWKSAPSVFTNVLSPFFFKQLD